MGTPKTWGLVAILLMMGVVGIFAYRSKEMFGKRPHSVTLHWEASANATSYNIYRRGETGAFVKIGSSQITAYEDTSVESGASYYYGVSTVSGKQESKISTVVHVEIPKN